MGKYRSLGTGFDKTFRNDLNANFDDIDKDIKAETSRAKAKENEIDNRVTNVNERISDIISQSGTSDTEVVDARGGYTVLRDRLESIDSQMAHNAKKIKVISEVSIHDYESYIPNKNDDPEEWLWADALDAAFTDLTTNYTGGVVKFGSRIYKFERPVKLYRYQRYTIYGKPSTGYTHGAPLSHIKLEGTNVHETILAMSEGNTTGLFDTRASENEGKYNFAIDISDMALVGNNYQGVSLIISGDTPAYLMNFKQVSFLRFDKGFDHDRALGNDGYAFFYNCYFRNNNNGFRIGGDNNLFSGCIVERNKGYGAIFKKTHGCHFSGGKIQYNATEHDPNLGDEQVYFNDCDAIKFSGTYFEPAHSTIPEENYTRALVRFHGVDGQEVNSVSFDGCYIFANKLSYFARTTGSGRVNSLSVSNSFLQYFKLMSHANLIGLENTSILNDVSFLNNTISYFTDSNDQPTESWRITNINVGERVKPRTPLYSLENATDNSDIYFVNGSVSPDGSQTYFGDSYTVAKVETGKYKITLRRGNNGTRLKNSSIFPAVVTPRLTDNEANANVVKFASIRSISNSEFEVLIHDREGVLIDGAFSFMVFATFRK